MFVTGFVIASEVTCLSLSTVRSWRPRMVFDLLTTGCKHIAAREVLMHIQMDE